MNNKIEVLLTNDDGINAPGLKHLWQYLQDEFSLSIAAPVTQKSGVGAGVTLYDPIRVERVDWENDTNAWRVSGTPADCVKMALGKLLSIKPQIIVSGINRGSNAGRNVIYSGTVGGVIEGALANIPGIAISCESYKNPNYHIAQGYIAELVRYVLKNPLPQGTFLNVNIPSTNEIKGIKLASQGRGLLGEDIQERVHPEGSRYYWLGIKQHIYEECEDSDIKLLGEGFLTAVPIHISQLTDMDFLEQHKERFSKSFDRASF